jgi:hypothetical protein
MSRTVMHTEVETWEEEVCDNCGHGEGMHYKTPKKVLVSSGSEYIAFGCIILKKGGRQLEGQHSDNLRRCECIEFK